MKEKYNLGLVSVSFRKHSPKGILEAVRASGLSCIEWGSDVHAPCRDDERLREIARLQREYGIKCSSYGTYFRIGETPIDELENYIKAAKILDTDILRLWCGTRGGKDMTEPEKNVLLEICRKAAIIAENNSVTLCMECHQNTFTENPDDAVWLMENVNSQHFRMYWQPFQWQSAEQNIENAKKIAPYAEHIHVFNWDGDLRLKLSGAVDVWKEYLNQFDKNKTLLLEFMPDGKIESLCEETKALREIVNK
jgi:sugar phosphate isomerase/epimerase